MASAGNDETLYRVGNFLQPLPGDPAVKGILLAREEARRMASDATCTPIAIWGQHDETIALFLNGEEFQPV
ncbi:hypothetical protein IB232_21355 [Pseudomonas sp. PDM15]|uniref:hypothetical protein n=1 Tax=Pseudomonas sp. PDM15 TaxID=2769303 RepID=UPI001781D3ED|nr:hypothetical protein [Pseudomonas sp. PDM15]MBD9427888.1 hypothetical protein [Pseudomonas sp. PDM15]